MSTVGLIGYGRINQYIAERVNEHDTLSVEFVYTLTPAAYSGSATTLREPEELAAHGVDLVIEAATQEAVQELGPQCLAASDMLILSTTALSDKNIKNSLLSAATDTTAYVPHGAVLGTDGLRDGRAALHSVSIETRKHPDNIDFKATSDDPTPITEETVLYDGSTRGICVEFPRNVNSHATIALAGVGFDDTDSTLIADPGTDVATHHIIAKGDGTELRIERTSDIEGVTGTYTLASVWGTVKHLLQEKRGLTVV